MQLRIDGVPLTEEAISAVAAQFACDLTQFLPLPPDAMEFAGASGTSLDSADITTSFAVGGQCTTTTVTSPAENLNATFVDNCAIDYILALPYNCSNDGAVVYGDFGVDNMITSSAVINRLHGLTPEAALNRQITPSIAQPVAGSGSDRTLRAHRAQTVEEACSGYYFCPALRMAAELSKLPLDVVVRAARITVKAINTAAKVTTTNSTTLESKPSSPVASAPAGKAADNVSLFAGVSAAGFVIACIASASFALLSRRRLTPPKADTEPLYFDMVGDDRRRPVRLAAW